MSSRPPSSLIGFVRTRDSYSYAASGASSASGPAHMEVGAITKGKGKEGGWKGKEKSRLLGALRLLVAKGAKSRPCIQARSSATTSGGSSQ